MPLKGNKLLAQSNIILVQLVYKTFTVSIKQTQRYRLCVFHISSNVIVIQVLQLHIINKPT